MTSQRAVQALADVPLFGGLTKQQLRSVLEATDEVTFEADEAMTEEGMYAIDFYLILEGEAEVVSRGDRVAALGPGDHFGELAVIDGERRSATVRSTTRVRALRLTADDFQRLLRATPEVAYRVLVGTVRLLRDAQASDET